MIRPYSIVVHVLVQSSLHQDVPVGPGVAPRLLEHRGNTRIVDYKTTFALETVIRVPIASSSTLSTFAEPFSPCSAVRWRGAVCEEDHVDYCQCTILVPTR